MPFQPLRKKYEGTGRRIMVNAAERKPQHNKDHIKNTALPRLGLIGGDWKPNVSCMAIQIIS